MARYDEERDVTKSGGQIHLAANVLIAVFIDLAIVYHKRCPSCIQEMLLLDHFQDIHFSHSDHLKDISSRSSSSSSILCCH